MRKHQKNIDLDQFLDDDYVEVSDEVAYTINGGAHIKDDPNERPSTRNETETPTEEKQTGTQQPAPPTIPGITYPPQYASGNKPSSDSSGNDGKNGGNGSGTGTPTPPGGGNGGGNGDGDGSSTVSSENGTTTTTEEPKNLTEQAYPSLTADFAQGFENPKYEEIWGRITNEQKRLETMQQFKETKLDTEMNGQSYNKKKGIMEDNLFSLVGCKMEGTAKIATEITGTEVSILKVNEWDVNKDGNLTLKEIADGITPLLTDGKKLTTMTIESPKSKNDFNSFNKKNGKIGVLGKADGVKGGDHWVVLEGCAKNEKAQYEFIYNQTSNGDILNDRKYLAGSPSLNQTNYFKISRMEVFIVE